MADRGIIQRVVRLVNVRLRRRHGFAGFVTTAPDARHLVDLFRGEWASRLPPPYDGLPAGDSELFDDARIRWAVERFGGVESADVLELGPLEGAHTAMLLAAGAASVTAVEANGGAYLRCLVVKELLGLDGAQFKLGDFGEFLRTAGERRFDAAVACGVLYHLSDPVDLLAQLAARTDRLMVWTHYYDAVRIAAHPTLRKRIRTSEPAQRAGFRHTRQRHDYGRSIRGAHFWGGNRGHASWLSRDDLLGAVAHLGFDSVEIAFDHPDHPNGPALALVAQRTAA